MAKTVYEREISSTDLGIIISYPTSVSGVIVLNVPTKYRQLNKEKIKMPPEITHTLTIFAEHGMIADIP